MKEPFEPEMPTVPMLTAIEAQGKAVFEANTCSSCHGDNGEGSAAGSKLIGIRKKHQPDKLEALLKQPSDKMSQGGMTPLEVSDEEMKALLAFLYSLR